MADESCAFLPLSLGPDACRFLGPELGAVEPPIRAVIFGASRFSEHGRSLARAQEIAAAGEHRASFFPRLEQNVAVLREARSLLEAHARQGHHLAPAAGWLIDNGALLEQQLATVRQDLPRRYFQKLPHLRDAALAGLPRIYGLAWAWVAHTDSGLDEDLLELFLSAYQSQRELTLAELWAIPTTLRVVLIENLRRLAERAATAQAARDAAHRWVDQPAAHGDAGLLERLGNALQARGVIEAFALQLQRRSDDWPAAAAAQARAWLACHLPDPAGALQRQQQQAAEDHHSVRSAMTSLRGLDPVDWRGVLMRSNPALSRLQQQPVFAAEAEATQDLSLHEIERLARRTGLAESQVSDAVLQLSLAAAGSGATAAATAPLYWLRGGGRTQLLQVLGRAHAGRLARLRRACRKVATPAYLATLLLATGGLVGALLHRAAAPDLPGWAWAVSAFLLAWPASEAVVAIVNRLISESLPPRRLPRLALADGIPVAQRTLVVIPALLTRADAAQALAGQLEQHHLANPERHAQFALLSDWGDADSAQDEGDAALLQAARSAVEQLNRRHPALPGEPLRFLLLHRERRWSDSEQAWIGWERKRGKLEQLIAWLATRGASPFIDLGALSTPAPAVRSVVTLDSDTDMPPGRLRELVAIAAHPMNAPVVDAKARRVSAGYGILQPRVAVPLPEPGALTPFHWLFSGQWGIDTYSAATSEIYEDLFAEGSFTGKGLLDVAAVHAVLSQRLPESQVLSHDLLEGALARCASVSDVTLVEDAPAHPDVAASRLHRWTRGDWQLLPFLLQPRRWPMAAINRWKIFDNLRRSLVAPLSLLLLLWVLASGALPVGVALWLVLAAHGAGPLLGAVGALAPQRDDLALGLFFGRTLQELARALLGTLWHLAQLLAQALRQADAVGRALVRQFHSRRHLLQWTTAAAVQAASRSDLRGLLQRHARVPLTAAVLLGLLLLARALGQPVATGWAVALCAVWAAAPLWTWLASRRVAPGAETLDAAAREHVRSLAADIWSYFQRHVGEDDNHLPPDNVQLTGPEPMVAHRTSPTNIGLYLLATASARELGLIAGAEMVLRVQRTLATMDRLPRWRGHFYNWYDTQSLAVLAPAYVSAVDSGNLSGHLLVLASACSELAAQPRWDAPLRRALQASARRLRPLVGALAGTPALSAVAQQAAPVSDAEGEVEGAEVALLRTRLQHARRELDALLQAQHQGEWPLAMRRLLEHVGLLQAWLQDHDADAAALRAQLPALAAHARTLALAADFSALYDPRRRLLHIGHAVETGKPDASHYDLLASEARLASLVGIAKGDLPPRHWSALGRPLFSAAGLGGRGVGLKSWSGSMFEYLMPTLVLAEPAGSVLHEATRAAVAAQRRDAQRDGLPWGVSESAIAVQDHTLAYQYGPQGVASLALRRTPPDERVVAPYATVLALLVAPRAAVENLLRLEALGARRSLGFIEALDYTPRRQPSAATRRYVAVETFMSHHQAMSLLACTHVLGAAAVQRWAAAEPHLRAVLPLLQERAPCQVPPLRMPPEALPAAPAQGQRWQHECRPQGAALAPMHLLGNDRYGVALRANGAGFSLWQGQALTRWRDDALRDAHGLFGYIRRDAEPRWVSLSARPAPDAAAEYRTEFHPDRVLLHARWSDLAATTTVSVSARDDCELRTVELHNTGRRPLRLTLALAFEAVLAPQAADEAHAAFSNLFVQARWSAAERALFLQRRPRLAHEKTVHAVHFLAACDDPLAQVSACADRARWLGRLGSSAEPAGDFDAAGEAGGERSAVHADAPRAGLADEASQPAALDTGLDPAGVISVRLTLAPGARRTLCFVLAAADDEDTLRALVDRCRQPAAAPHARELSETLARIRLRELRLDLDSWVAWLHLNTLLVSAMTRSVAAPASAPDAGIDRRLLWRHGIGGGRPILALWVEGPEGIDLARQSVSMLALWTAAGQAPDLVVVNAEPASYLAPVREAFTALAEMAALRVDAQLPAERRARLTLLQQRDLQPAEQATLRLLARVTLHADGRSLAQHLERLLASHDEDQTQRRRFAPGQAARTVAGARPAAGAAAPVGRFDAGDAAFSFRLDAQSYPARPWINVLANPDFGCQVSEAGAGFCWAGNSSQHQITAASNDALCDPAGEAVLLQDLDSLQVWPLGRSLQGGRSVTHGIGSTRMQQSLDGLDIELVWCVDAESAIKQLRVSIGVASGGARRLRLLGYAEWLLGATRAARATLATRPQRWMAPAAGVAAHGAAAADAVVGFALHATQLDAAGGRAGATAFLAWRPDTADVPARVWLDLDDWTCDRREFFDRDGRFALPARLRGRSGAGLDACAAVACRIELARGQRAHTALLLGHTDSAEAAARLAQQACTVAPTERQARQIASWVPLLDSVQVRSPDPLFDALVNRWLPYQAIACRLWARAGFYQAGGAYGFRDQLQDAMNLAQRAPELLPRQIRIHAARQFEEGDVQHWWHPPLGAGVRTRMSDDLLWLPLAVAHCLQRGGSEALLDEPLPFLHSAPVPAGREDLYETPAVSAEQASVYEHGARAIDHSLRVGMGTHGLPLMGTGDWNDGMNRVGDQGRGESVWLGWFLCRVIDDYAPLAERRGERERAQAWRRARAALALALDREGWDGQWYRRAFFDDGTPLGAAANAECRIDLIAQAWAVLSGAGDPARAAQAMASAQRALWDDAAGLMKLLDPPLAHAQPSAGYIQAYPGGIRENGGQYNHGAVWALMACAQLGDAASAWQLFQAISPAHRSAAAGRGPVYGLEPYVVAGDIYSQPPYAGRGGWSWYTGAASWLQRAALESICGLVRSGRHGRLLRLQPCLPPHWPQLDITLRHQGRDIHITVCRDAALARQWLARAPLSLGVGCGDSVDLDALADGSRLVLAAGAAVAPASTPSEVVP
jgi:cyclic beta-1,2-glucan synthetase